jgi:hypothetical protein
VIFFLEKSFQKTAKKIGFLSKTQKVKIAQWTFQLKKVLKKDFFLFFAKAKRLMKKVDVKSDCSKMNE